MHMQLSDYENFQFQVPGIVDPDKFTAWISINLQICIADPDKH